jgi:hypothetical protein
MWSGGFSVGPRYLVPMLPFLALPIIFALDAIQSPWFKGLVSGLVVWSFLVVWAETIGGQSFPQFQSYPLLEYSVPRLLAGDLARNAGMVLGLRGVFSVIPLIGILSVLGVGFLFGERRVRPRLVESQT